MSTIKPDKVLPVWDKYWRLTVLWEYRYKPVWSKPKYIWQEKLQCDCWNIVRARRTDVEKWVTKSCWCYINSNRHILCGNRKWKKINLTHWDTYTRLYRIYRNIKSRCNNPKSTSYPRYWWRWIKCLRDTYEDFKKDMWESYSKHIEKYWIKNTSIDRINNSWNYCKKNCRWATYKEQANNTRRNKINFNSVKDK